MSDMSTATGNIVTSDKIVGVKVKNRAAEKLGEINNLVLDKVSGRVCYVTLSVGGFLGIGEKEVAVPWNALNYNVSEGCFILDANKEKLTNAKKIERGFSDWSNQTWGSEVYRGYGTKPYWENDIL